MKSLLFIIISFSIFQNTWKTTDYEQYTAESFFNRDDVNQQIILDNIDFTLLNAAIFYATNHQRKKKKRTLFSHNQLLENVSVTHSNDMHNFKFFSHTNNKDRNKKTPLKRIEMHGGYFSCVGENLAQVSLYHLSSQQNYFLDAQNRAVDKNGKPLEIKTYAQLAHDVVDGWMHSKGHRENILNKDYILLGCGTSPIRFDKNGIPEILITQNFACL